jgi:ferredoxin
VSYFVLVLLLAFLFLFGNAVYFILESIKEKEYRAPKVGAGLAISIVLLAAVILWVPIFRIPITVALGLGVIFGIILLVPGKPGAWAMKGAEGHIVGEPERHDERDIPFARLRSVPPGSEYYKRYYQMHPEKEAADAMRREKGLLGHPGSIDGQYRPNVSMMEAAFDIPEFLGPYAESEAESDSPPSRLSPERATEILKKYALHIGADMVGICRINPLWLYSNRGEIFFDRWDDWGKEIDPDTLPANAVVMLVEMHSDHVYGAPHTPTVAESAGCYAKGSYLSTLLARAPKFGARVRIFAAFTDMPLIPDKPISIGADEFCKRCKKCAESCPSKSILLEEKVVYKGAAKWKLDADSCFKYWSKVGTDCSICMAVCPFSRPNTSIHKVVRWFVARSPIAQRIFPYIDNFLYGKKWRPKPVPSWLDYPKGKSSKKEVYGLGDQAVIG